MSRSSLRPVAIGLAAASAVAWWLLPAASARAEGNPQAGRALSERWCASCHVIGPGQGTAVAQGVPTFAGVAGMASTTEASLSVFLRTPHNRMPDLQLTNQEIADVSAYILSLRKR